LEGSISLSHAQKDVEGWRLEGCYLISVLRGKRKAGLRRSHFVIRGKWLITECCERYLTLGKASSMAPSIGCCYRKCKARFNRHWTIYLIYLRGGKGGREEKRGQGGGERKEKEEKKHSLWVRRFKVGLPWRRRQMPARLQQDGRQWL